MCVICFHNPDEEIASRIMKTDNDLFIQTIEFHV